MKRNYEDITSRIAEEPQWFDEVGTPRYGPFEPGLQGDIYAREVALISIECQNCGHRFEVCLSAGPASTRMKGLVRLTKAGAPILTLADLIRAGHIHYGDPPNIGCCPSGPTMNSIPLRVLQYWKHCYPSSAEEEWWKRDPAIEGDVKQWAYEEMP